MRKFIIPLAAILFGIVSFVYGENFYEKDVHFDPEFGGLYANEIIFNTYDSDMQKFDVMLSTVNSMTFLIDKSDCTDPDAQKATDGFCFTHKAKYDYSIKEGTGNSRKGGAKDMVETDLAGKGKTVVDKIQFGLGPNYLQIENSQFGVMNNKAEEDPKFWGIKRFKEEGPNKDKVEKGNKAEGCFSLLPAGTPAYEKDFDQKKTPMQALIDSALKQKIVSIQLDKVDQVPDNSRANGRIFFGTLAVNEQCHSWNMIEGTDAWNLQIEALEGVDEVKGKNAIIDTSSEQITVPKDAWEKMNGLVKEGECDLTKLKPLKFTFGGLVYEIPATHYLKKTKEGNTESCVRLLAQNSDELDQKVHLGLPFIRSSCVATDLKSKKVWLGGGVCRKEEGGGGDKPSGGDDHKNGAASAMGGGLASTSLIAFVVFAITAIIIH